jgi:hypothetical protein
VKVFPAAALAVKLLVFRESEIVRFAHRAIVEKAFIHGAGTFILYG